MRASGIDVSLWQDDNSTPQMVDFAKARQAGAVFAFMKASQSTWADQDFIMNWRNAKQAGMPRGAYHFLDWTAPAVEQARFFAGLLKGDPGELPPVLDFECRTGAPGRAAASKAAYTFLDEASAILGRELILYTSPGYWSEFGKPDPFFARFPLWIAHYYMDRPFTPAPWRDWLFWQWGTGKGLGPIFGAESKDIDMNWFNGSEEDLQKRFSLDLPPAPTPEPAAAFTMRVTTSALNVRSGPGTSYPVIARLQRGEEITVEDIGGQSAWALFRLANGREGWACAQIGADRLMIPADAANA